jgi:metallo-beta-lactamase family protein
MILNFIGGSKNPNGTCYLLESNGDKILIDCGRFYGKEEERNLKPFPFSPKEIKGVLLTHAHLDHAGLLPRLAKEGFEGKIFGTKATFDLLELLFEDYFKITQTPLFSKRDFQKIKRHFVCHNFNRRFKVTKNFEAKLLPSGHILGSSIVEVYSKKESLKIIFSGDLGSFLNPLLPPPSVPDSGDFTIMETIHGDIVFEEKLPPREIFEDIIEEVVKKRGVLLIPSFAIEKAQEIVYELNYLVENKKIPQITIFLDSALAFEAIKLYQKHQRLFKKEARFLINKGDNVFRFQNFHVIRSQRGRERALKTPPPKIIIAGSGFSEGGPILLYEKEYLSSRKTTLLFLSHQIEGTRGREIQEGAKTIEIFGKKIKVNAKIETIEGYSGHADQKELFEWIKKVKENQMLNKGEAPKGVFLVSGESRAKNAMANLIQDQLGILALTPEDGEKYLLKSQNFEKIK